MPPQGPNATCLPTMATAALLYGMAVAAEGIDNGQRVSERKLDTGSCQCPGTLAEWRSVIGSRMPLARGTATIPFSFSLDGKSSSELLPSWACTSTCSDLADGRKFRALRWESGSGLAVSAEVTLQVNADHPTAIDWVLQFENNNATAASGVISDVSALNAAWNVNLGDGAALRSAKGSGSWGDDYSPLTTFLQSNFTSVTFEPLDYFDGSDSGGNERMASSGRSSNGQMPFFFLEDAADRGVAVAVGWSGDWRATFDQCHRNGHASASLNMTVCATAGINSTRLVVLPEEHLRSARVLIVPFSAGDLAARGYPDDAPSTHAAGLAVLRRIILRWYSVRDNGDNVIFPRIAHLCYLDGKAMWSATINETNQMDILRSIKTAPAAIEEYWVDVGWQQASRAANLGAGFCADWARPISTTVNDAFPRGMRPLFDYAKNTSGGMRSLKGVLWMLITCTYEMNYLNLTHPEWMLRSPENTQHPGKPWAPGLDLSTFGIDLANPDALEWVTQWVVDAMEEWNFDVFRHEIGMSYAHGPMWAWRDAEIEAGAAPRRGASEIKYIEGQYRLWDGVRTRRPGAVVDLCAGGGRMIDIESISRGIWKWRSDNVTLDSNRQWIRNDNPFLPVAHQSMTMGLSHYHPMNAHMAWYANGYHWRSSATTGQLIAWDTRVDSDAERQLLARAVNETLRMRPYLIKGDFWHLTEQSLDTSDWAAWQYHVPKMNSGCAFFFRRHHAPAAVMPAGLVGLRSGGMYRLLAYDDNYALVQNATMDADALRGYDITLSAVMSSLAIEYKLLS